MLPRLIQGGMGVGVSSWTLANEVASLGQLGVVSGTALDTILVRRLASGDVGGHLRRALATFPAPHIAAAVLSRYFRAEGTPPAGQRFPLLPLPGSQLSRDREWLLILANYVEVYLAKEKHDGVVGINYLHKIQFPTLPSLYGAMLAGVDAVLMGAGIPGDIPAALDLLSQNLPATITLDVQDAGETKHTSTFDPATLWIEAGIPAPTLARPDFLAIVSSATLARALIKKAPGGIQGFIVEAPTAGGHNAPPRGPQQLSVKGEPVYGDRDCVDLTQMVQLGIPFWLAGGFATRAKFREALAAGAHGIQIGTAFAFCEESGLEPNLRRHFLASFLHGDVDVFTDPAASPTSFPFKVATLHGSLSDEVPYESRPRLCDLGYLRRAFERPDGSLGYRCPGEPEAAYIRKGGSAEDTCGRKCLCNSLLANVGLGQRRADGYEELPLLTAGDDLECIRPFIKMNHLTYHARDVIDAVLPMP